MNKERDDFMEPICEVKQRKEKNIWWQIQRPQINLFIVLTLEVIVGMLGFLSLHVF